MAFKINKFEKIFCPFCGKETLADIHDGYDNKYDNWFCWDCDFMITPEELIEKICIGDDNEETINNLKKIYGLA